MPTARSILGLDLRVNSVKVVEIEHRKEGTFLNNWGLAEVPYNLVDKHPQKEDAQAEALRKLIHSRKIKTRDAAVVVGGADVFVRLYTLDGVGKAEVADVVKWKLAEELPFPVEEALIDYYPLPKSPGAEEKNDYIAACINIKLFKELHHVVRKAGLRLVAVTVLPDTLHEVFKKQIPKEQEKITSLVYMGKRTTNISIFKGENLEFNRELNIGGENITLAMSGVLVSADGRVEITPEEAEKIKSEHGVPVDVEKYPKLADIPVTQLQAMVRPALERIQDEVMRTFEYYRGQTGEAAVEKIILTGGSSLTINLVGFLSEGLGIPVNTPSAMEGRKYAAGLSDKAELEKVLPRLSTCIGTALVADRKLNLVPEEIKHYWKVMAQKVLKPQYVVSALVGILALLYLIFWMLETSLRNELVYVEQKLKEYRPRIATLDVLVQTAEEEKKRQLILESYGEKRTKMPRLFREISRVVPSSVYIDTLNMTPAKLRIWGTVIGVGDTAENVMSQFVLALSSSDYFENVKLIQALKNYDYVQNAFNFEIVADIKI
jgi:type IV pilus assembly protein PilM